MKLIYVAGPYRAATAAEVDHNIRNARDVAECVWRLGHAALCPHLNAAHMDGLVPDRNFLMGDLEMVKRCDAVVLVHGWEKSEGTRQEVELARGRGIPVYKDIHELLKGENRE